MSKSCCSPLLLLSLAVAPLACAESIGFDDEGLAEADDEDETAAEGDGDGEPDPTDGDGDDGVEHTELGGGVVRTTVDATDEADWVHLDLDTLAAVADGGAGWDLGFRRFSIIVNGGVSGAEGVEVAILDGAAFEQLSEVPDDAVWITDAADGPDEDEDPDLAFVDWYDYDFMTHVLTPKDRVYLVRGTDGVVFKLQIADYYSEAGTSGHLKFYWAAL